MKKLLAVLLALVVVGGAFAQVTMKAAFSGSVYLENSRGDDQMISSLSRNGGGYDTLTLSATGKENKYGFMLKDNNLFSSGYGVDYWNVWYDIDFAKVSIGAFDFYDNNYVQFFNNGWIGNYDPAAFSGQGLLVESKDLSGLTVAAFLPLPAAAAPAVKLTKDDAKAASIGASYALGETATLKFLVSGFDFDAKNTSVNVGFGFTGVENLDTYGWATYNLDETMAFGVGGQYKTSTYRVGAEFEANKAGEDLAFDAVANARYYIQPTLFVQARGAFYNEFTEYSNSATTTVALGDSRIRAMGYVNYAFGNGFAAEAMLGYDTLPTANYTKYDASLIHYLRLTYSVSF